MAGEDPSDRPVSTPSSSFQAYWFPSHPVKSGSLMRVTNPSSSAAFVGACWGAMASATMRKRKTRRNIMSPLSHNTGAARRWLPLRNDDLGGFQVLRLESAVTGEVALPSLHPNPLLR